MRWTIEEDNETGKDLLGLTQHQVRSWTGWRQHVITVMLALAFLAVTRAHLPDDDSPDHPDDPHKPDDDQGKSTRTALINAEGEHLAAAALGEASDIMMAHSLAFANRLPPRPTTFPLRLRSPCPTEPRTPAEVADLDNTLLLVIPAGTAVSD